MRAIWARLDAGQRLTIGAVLLATMVGLGAIVWFAGRPDYEIIHQAQDATELDEATQALTKAGVAFKPDGFNLLVDREIRAAAQSALAQAGVRSRNDRDDITALGSFTLDSSSRREVIDGLKRRRAEIAVRKMTGVMDAYVTADQPKRSPYAALDAENTPRAAVTITTAHGESFRVIARAAIAQVSSALSIPEESVTAINTRTKERFSIGEVRGGALDTGDFLSQQRARGEELRARAQQILDRLYPDRALLTVTVDLDPAWERRVEQIQPETPAIVSDDTVTNKTQNSMPSSGGDPSASAATTGAAGAASGGQPLSTSNQETRKREYTPFSGKLDKGMLAPDIRRLSVALVLDESIDKAKHQSIEETVKNAVGFAEQRASGLSDSFRTLQEKFPELPDPTSDAPSPWLDTVAEHGGVVGQVVAVALVLLFLRSLLRRSGKASATVGVGAAPAAGTSGDAGAVPSADDHVRQLRREIEQSIAEDPAAISRLLEGWLAEQRT